MASFFIPLTGLESDSVALNTIANDLSNLNTTAFKSTATRFSDLFYQQLSTTGAGDPIQLGAGVQVASNSTDFTQGSLQTTGTSTDVALSGSGFFVLGNAQGDQQYSRAGNFSMDSTGALEANSGMKVMGYPAVNGVVNTSSPLTAIQIPVGQVEQPKATVNMSMVTNLNAASTTGTTFQGQETVYDSLGNSHVVTVNYTKTGTNTWSYSASLPATDFTSGTQQTVSGSMTFDSAGTLTNVSYGSPATSYTVGTGTGQVQSIPLGFTGLADGAANLSMKWGLLSSSNTPNIGQVATASTVSTTAQDGYASGQYQSFSIGSDGTVTATYSNGQQVAIGQLAVANIANQQGLNLQGNGNYATTLASGTASIGVAGTGGRGTVTDGSLEESNVNISEAFSNLIIAQRSFEANSKAITTFDTVTQDTINMMH